MTVQLLHTIRTKATTRWPRAAARVLHACLSAVMYFSATWITTGWAHSEDRLLNRPGSTQSNGQGANPSQGIARSQNQLELRFKATAQTESSIVKLGDVVEVLSWGERVREGLLDVTLAPAPQFGVVQHWSSADILHHLELRGVKPAQVAWVGAKQVGLQRVPPTPQATGQSATPRPQMMPAYLQSRTMAQAEANLIQATREYLAFKTGESTDWRISLRVPPEHAAALAIQRNLVSIGGGAAPWTGAQEISFVFNDRGQEIELALTCDIQLPPLVVVAVTSLRRDQILSAADLAYAPLPERTDDQLGQFADSIEELVGKQLRRSMSTGQPIALSAVAQPKVISAGEPVEVESISGSVSVKTAAKAISGGAVGELISVELLSNRQRLQATVVGPRAVRIAASAPLLRSNAQPPMRPLTGPVGRPTARDSLLTAETFTNNLEYR